MKIKKEFILIGLKNTMGVFFSQLKLCERYEAWDNV